MALKVCVKYAQIETESSVYMSTKWNGIWSSGVSLLFYDSL